MLAIQFRPGGSLGKLIVDRALEWGVSQNETAKRLALLALYELDVRHYSAINEISDCLGGIHGFEQACQHVLFAVEGANRMRRNSKQDPLDESGRVQFIEQSINEFVRQRKNIPEKTQE